MTTFWREGHWRYRDGVRHWVEGHFVERDNWDRLSWANLTLNERSDWLISFIHAHDFAEVKSLLVPNARCPECDAEVYFFRHHNGGCAWFNDIPWPWPKHECMDVVGTKCSAEYIAKQDETLKKIAETQLIKKYANERVTELKLKAFAERFFHSVDCKKCERKEYEFELSDSSLRRFTDIGERWVKSECTILDNGEHERAKNAKYLDDFIKQGGKWKTSIPSNRRSPIDAHSVYDNIGAFFFTGQSVFYHNTNASKFTIPAYVICCHDLKNTDMLIVLESLVFPEHQILIRTRKSNILQNAKIVFLRGKINNPESYNVSYLCLDTGLPKRMQFKLCTFLNIGKRRYKWEGITYDSERLEKLFEMYTEMTGGEA